MRISVSSFCLLVLLISTTTLSLGHECGAEKYQIEIEPIDGLHETDHHGRILAGGYDNIRIVVDYTYFTAPDTQTETYIKNILVPNTINYFQKTLSVIPLAKNITSSSSTLCGLNMTNQFKNGGAGAAGDLLVFITGALSTDTLIAWARPCSYDSVTKRPVIGQINFNYKYIWGNSSTNPTKVTSDLAVAMHEFTHVLAFSSSLYSRFINPTTNQTLTDVIKYQLVNGNNQSYLNLPTVTSFVRDYFNCPTAVAYLENQGSTASQGVHWERRIFYNEYMTASAIANTKITNLTFSLFVDSGWYQVDWSMSEYINWGQNRGCDFINQTCLVNTSLARFPEFCAPKGSGFCTFDGKAKGVCGTSNLNFDYNLSSSMDYWGNKSTVPDSYADNCPIVYSYSNGNCEDPASNTSRWLTTEYFGPGGRCFFSAIGSQSTSNTSAKGYCLKMECLLSSTNTWLARIYFGAAFVNCTAEGKVRVPTGLGLTGFVDCPDPTTYCRTQYPQYCNKGCFGNGNCVRSPGDLQPHCECNPGFTGSDCSNFTGVINPVPPRQNVTNGTNSTNNTPVPPRQNVTNGTNSTNNTPVPPKQNITNNTNTTPVPPKQNVTNSTNNTPVPPRQNGTNSTNTTPVPPRQNTTNGTNTTIANRIIIGDFIPIVDYSNGVNYQQVFGGTFNVQASKTGHSCNIVVLNGSSVSVFSSQNASITIRAGILKPGTFYTLRITCKLLDASNVSSISFDTRSPPKFTTSIQNDSVNAFYVSNTPSGNDYYRYRYGYIYSTSLFRENSPPNYGNVTFVNTEFSQETYSKIKIPDPTFNRPAFIVVVALDSYGLYGYTISPVSIIVNIPNYIQVLDFKTTSTNFINYQKEYSGNFTVNSSSTYNCNWRVFNSLDKAVLAGQGERVFIKAFSLLDSSMYKLSITCRNQKSLTSSLNVTLYTSTPPSCTLNMTNNIGVAINTTFVGTVTSKDPYLLYRFGYFRTRSDFNERMIPNFGFPVYLDTEFSSNTSVSFTLPNFDANNTQVFVIAIALDAYGLYGYSISSVIVRKFIPNNIVSYLSSNLKQEFKNSADILKVAYNAQVLLNTTNSTNTTTSKELKEIKNNLVQTLCVTNTNDSDSNTFIQTARLIQDFTQNSDIVDGNTTKKVVDYMKDQIYTQNMVVDKTTADTVLNVLSNSLTALNKQQTDSENKTTTVKEDDKTQIKAIYTLTNTITSQVASSLDVGEKTVITTSAVKILLAKSDANVSQSYGSSEVDSDSSKGSVKLTLPPLPSNIQIDGTLSVAMKVWTQNIFSTLSNATIGSGVVSFSCFDNKGEVNVSNLTEKFKLNFTIPITNTSKQINLCRFWNTVSQLWDSRGCKLVKTVDTKFNRTVYCECDHLTDFAIENQTITNSTETEESFHFISLIVFIIFAVILTITAIWAACSSSSIKAKTVFVKQSSRGTNADGTRVQKIKRKNPSSNTNNINTQAPVPVRPEEFGITGNNLWAAFKNTHNFFGVFTYDSFSLTKAARAFIFIIRWHTFFIVTTGMFYGSKVKSIDPFNPKVDSFEPNDVASAFIVSIVVAFFVTSVFRYLFNQPRSGSSSSSALAYCIGVVYCAILFGISAWLISKMDADFDSALTKTIIIEIIWDMTVNHVIKFFIGYIMTCLCMACGIKSAILVLFDKDAVTL